MTPFIQLYPSKSDDNNSEQNVEIILTAIEKALSVLTKYPKKEMAAKQLVDSLKIKMGEKIYDVIAKVIHIDDILTKSWNARQQNKKLKKILVRFMKKIRQQRSTIMKMSKYIRQLR